MNALLKRISQIIAFLFSDLIVVALIAIGAIAFVVFLPDYALFLSLAWAIAVIAIDVRYFRHY